MEAGDKEALALWAEFRDLSIVEYKKIYGWDSLGLAPPQSSRRVAVSSCAARLGVTFDVFSGESQVSDGMEAAFALMKEKNLVHLSQGATLVDLEAHKKGLGKCLIKKTDGSSLYITRGAWRRRRFVFSASSHSVAPLQTCRPPRVATMPTSAFAATARAALG